MKGQTAQSFPSIPVRFYSGMKDIIPYHASLLRRSLRLFFLRDKFTSSQPRLPAKTTLWVETTAILDPPDWIVQP